MTPASLLTSGPVQLVLRTQRATGAMLGRPGCWGLRGRQETPGLAAHLLALYPGLTSPSLSLSGPLCRGVGAPPAWGIGLEGLGCSLLPVRKGTGLALIVTHNEGPRAVCPAFPSHALAQRRPLRLLVVLCAVNPTLSMQSVLTVCTAALWPTWDPLPLPPQVYVRPGQCSAQPRTQPPILTQSAVAFTLMLRARKSLPLFRLTSTVMFLMHRRDRQGTRPMGTRTS